jgi:hypothetical protein
MSKWFAANKPALNLDETNIIKLPATMASIMVYKIKLLMWLINMFIYGAMPMS